MEMTDSTEHRDYKKEARRNEGKTFCVVVGL